MILEIGLKKRDNYTIVLVSVILVLFFLMLGTFYKIQESKDLQNLAYSKLVTKSSFTLPSTKIADKKIYVCTSKYTAKFYIRQGLGKDTYLDKIEKFSKFISSIGYKVSIIPLSKVSNLSKDSIVFLPDAQVLSTENKQQIREFLNRGGSLFFNFLAGFKDENDKYQAEKFVNSITGLKLSQKRFAKFKDGLTLTLKILSPFSSYLKDGKLLEGATYDDIPLYITNLQKPDIFATAYNRATPPISKDFKNSINLNESGVAWHGYYGKGKWVYTTMPTYSFSDIEQYKDDFKKIMAGMIKFLSQDAIVSIFPYIDQKSVVFISEDTEYKYQNFRKFSDLAYKYKIPVTAFIVAGIATRAENIELTKEVAKNPYVEYASHSTTHTKIVGQSESYIINETTNSKKIIDKFAKEPIIGFRPPREELNDLMEKHLQGSGFYYVLGSSERQNLYPKFEKKFPNILYIPRRGTDDYSYLVNLDWSQKEILKQILKEVKFITSLNGIYTFSMHTHLFAYKSNINIVEAFFKYLKKHPEYKVLDGRHLAFRVALYKKLKIDYNDKEKKITIINSNPVDVKNLKIQIFAKEDKVITIPIIQPNSTKIISLKGVI